MKEWNRAKRDLLRVLNKQITIQKPVVEIGGIGQQYRVYKDWIQVWASAKNLYGGEFYQAKQVREERTVKVTIRYLSGLDETMRILMDGELYNIVFIDDIRLENEYMEIRCLKVSDSLREDDGRG